MQTWTPTTDGYDDQRLGIQRLDPHRPARIAGVTSSSEIQEAVRYARDHHLRVAVQGRGHGHTTPTEGVLITTREFAGVSSTRTAVRRPFSPARPGSKSSTRRRRTDWLRCPAASRVSAPSRTPSAAAPA